MKTVLFILMDRKDGKEQMRIYSVPLEKYVPVATYTYLEEGQSVPISGHAVAFDGEDLRGIFRITVAYPGNGRAFLPRWGEIGALLDSVCYSAYIVYEPEVEKEASLDDLPLKNIMYPRTVLEILSI